MYQTRAFLCQLGQVLLFVFWVSDVYSVVFPCFWLSVPVQSIVRKDSSPKMTGFVSSGTLNPTHSVTHWIFPMSVVAYSAEKTCL